MNTPLEKDKVEKLGLLYNQLFSQQKCEKCSIKDAFKNTKGYENLATATPFICVVLPLLLGPSLALIWLFFDPCIPQSSRLFWSLFGIYVFLMLMVLGRETLYITNARFCSRAVAISRVKFFYCTGLLQGAFLNYYLLYTWCHNLIALAGSGITAMFYVAFYIAMMSENHLMYCVDDAKEHRSQTNCATCKNGEVYMDFIIVIATLIFFIIAFWFDDDLNFVTRQQGGKCLAF
jgi:hypothetical protein